MEKGYGSACYKESAIRTLQTWLNDEPLKGCEDSKRAGTSRGEKIGMGRDKIAAAGLLILHPVLSLQEISKIAGVSYGLLRKWKTEKDFKAEMQKLAHNFGTDFARCVVAVNVEDYLLNPKVEKGLAFTTIGNKIILLKSHEPLFNSFLESTKDKKIKKKKIFIIDDSPTRWTKVYQQKYTPKTIKESLMPLLPWYGSGVIDAFLKLIKDHMYLPGVPGGLLMMHKALFFWEDYDESRVISWQTRPEMLELWEAAITSTVDVLTNHLANPKPSSPADKENIKELSGLLQLQIRGIFRILRDKT
ncbi:MAG: hypothetical protein WCW53_06870 [Syntrophales bacterium]|jgi:hypothetical protein|nr:hypothetical protein [Syntrophales bacterium]